MNNSNYFKQPEALRLADALEADQQGIDLGAEGMGWGPSTATRTQAAAELRRLYAEVDSLSYRLAYPDNFVKEPEQEPVAIADGTFNHNCPVGTLLYTSPPASKPWVGLTKEDRYKAIRPLYCDDATAALAACHSNDEYEAIEAKLKEKNAQPSKPLTDEQISDLWDGHTVPVFGKTGINPIVFARAIESAHGIKENT